MKLKQELTDQILKHTLMMKKVFDNLKLLLREKAFKELLEMARAYFKDSRHFYDKDMLVQSFEALMISWTYIDAGIRLDVFELQDDSLKSYFTKE